MFEVVGRAPGPDVGRRPPANVPGREVGVTGRDAGRVLEAVGRDTGLRTVVEAVGRDAGRTFVAAGRETGRWTGAEGRETGREADGAG